MLKAAPAFPAPPPFPNTNTNRLERLEIHSVQEAKQCLEDIEEAATRARVHIAFLQEVAQGVRSYLEDQSTPLRADLNLPELRSVQEAKEYLINIEKASAAAQEYLVYLEEKTLGVTAVLAKLEEEGDVSSEQTQAVDESNISLDDLEKISSAAKDYLSYLKTVVDVVQQYLVDPNLKGIEDFIQDDLPDELSPRATRTIVKNTNPPAVRQPPSAFQQSPPTPAVPQESRPVSVTRTIVPPATPGLKLDISEGAQPVDMTAPVCPVDSDSGAATPPTRVNYLDSLRSNFAKAKPTVRNDNMGYLSSRPPQPKTRYKPASTDYPSNVNNAGRGALSDAAPSLRKPLDSLAPFIEQKTSVTSSPSIGSRYLDSKPQQRAPPFVETPTRRSDKPQSR